MIMSEELFTSAKDELCTQLSKLVKHIQCSICGNLMVKPKMTRCLHRYCGECITRSIESNGDNTDRCPLCYEQITVESLRDQFELNDLIINCRKAINTLKNDTNLSMLLENTVLISLNDSSITGNINNNSINNKENDESIGDINVSEMESNPQKFLTIDEPMASWPTTDSICDDINETNNNNIGKLSETQNVNNLSNSPLNLTSNPKQSNNIIQLINDNKVKTNGKHGSVEQNTSLQVKTQHLIVNRSSVSYGFQRKPKPKINDIFDKIISKATKTECYSKKPLKPFNSNKRRKSNKPNRRYNILTLIEDERDIDLDAAKYAEDLVSPMTKLNQQNQSSKSATNLISTIVNENTNQFKRIRNIDDSSDDEMIENHIKHDVKNVELKEGNGKVFENEFSETSDDELMISIHSNNDQMKESSNIISSDVSIHNDANSMDSFNSETHSMLSSPILFDGSI